MPCSTKKYYFFALLSVSFLLSYCAGNQRHTKEEKSIHSYENKLQELIDAASQLPDDIDRKSFTSIYNEAVTVMNLIPDSSQIKAESLLFFTDNLMKKGGYREAIRNAWEYLNSSHTGKNHIGAKINVYGKLANLYQIIGERDSGLYVLRLGMVNAGDSSTPKPFVSSINNLGIYLYQYGKPDTAMNYFKIADSILMADYFKDGEDWNVFRGSVLDNMATIYEDRHEFKKALDIYEKNFNGYKHADDPFRLVNAGISLANAELELNNDDRAKLLLGQMAGAIDTMSYKDKATNEFYLYQVFAKYFIKKNNYREAYAYEKRASTLSDSIRDSSEELIKETNNQLALLQSERFDETIAHETTEREEETRQSRFRLWIVLLISFAVLMMLASLSVYYRQRSSLQLNKAKLLEEQKLRAEEHAKIQEQEKKLLDMELEFKKKDMADLALNLSQNQEWAKEMIEKIGKIESTRGNQRNREIKRMKDEIHARVFIDEELELLQQNMDTLNNEFYDRLKKQFTNLSKTEIKMCSYIRLNLSIAQIAQLQNIDPESVRTNRYRLKKKLAVRTGEDMDSFLQNL